MWGIAYDPDNDMYYCTYEVSDGVYINGAVSSSFGLIDKAFPLLTDTVKEAAGLSASDALVAEQAVVYGQQILQLFSGPGAAYIAQHNYADNSLKKAYRIASNHLTGDEPKALVNVSGKIYMLTDIANTAGQRYVSVSELMFDSRIDGQRREIMAAHMSVETIPVGIALRLRSQTSLLEIRSQQAVAVVLQQRPDVQVAGLFQRTVEQGDIA